MSTDKNKNKRKKDIELETEIKRLLDSYPDYFSVMISDTTARNWYGNISEEVKISHIEAAKEVGGNHNDSAEVYEQTGIFIYAEDLCTCVEAPVGIKTYLRRLLNIYSYRDIIEEMANQIKKIEESGTEFIIRDKDRLEEMATKLEMSRRRK